MENASKAGLQTKIAAVEDEANSIYLDLTLKKQKGEIQEVTMQDIATKLDANGYKVKTISGSGNKVTGISVEPTSLNLGTGQTGTITVKPEGNTNGNSYYAIIDGKYYKINFSSQGITVDRTESNIEDSSGETQNLTASSSKTEVVGEPVINGMVVSVTAGATVGETTITITYGEYTKEVKVTVKVKPAEGSTETKNVNFSTAYGKIDVIWLEGETNKYNSTAGAKASTTGNIYGIYDMSGGAWEYTAGFNKEYTGDYFSNTNASYKPASGNHFAKQNGLSTKYATAYSNNTSANNLYTVGKTGEGIKEVYAGSHNSWHSDYANVVGMSYPFPVRGGNYNNGATAGVLAASYPDGYYNYYLSFRAVLVP